jgi:hypothetical protein
METTTMTMTAKFAGTCTRCNTRFTAGTQIEWQAGKGAAHTTQAGCDAAKASAVAAKPAPVPVQVGAFGGVIALFEKAKTHLKFPKIRLMCDGTQVVLSLAGAKSKTPGSVNIAGEGQYPNRAWFGRVSPEGQWIPARMDPAFQTKLTALLTAFSVAPAAVAKDHGKLTGNCCFCNKVLGLGEDRRSVVVGFGPVCADHWGLKSEWLTGVAAVVEPFAVPAAVAQADADAEVELAILRAEAEQGMTEDEIADRLAEMRMFTR